jgi:hypothetical protein
VRLSGADEQSPGERYRDVLAHGLKAAEEAEGTNEHPAGATSQVVDVPVFTAVHGTHACAHVDVRGYKANLRCEI